MAPVVLFAYLHDNTSGNIVQSNRITAVPVTEEFQRQVLQDLPRGTTMAKIIRGNNFNRPVFKGDVRPNLIREIYQYLSSVGNFDGYRKVTDADITDYSIRQNRDEDVDFEELRANSSVFRRDFTHTVGGGSKNIKTLVCPSY